MPDIETFDQFGLDPLILEAIKEIGYSTPTPIQSKAIPLILKGYDLMGAAQTGTGKTAGFGLPLINKILPHANKSVSPARHPVRALIMVPTRELASQVAENLTQYASKTNLRVAAVYGGVDIKPQAAELRKGVEILIATPGRLFDHLEQRNTSLNNVEIVVLDEADRMLDMGFLPDIVRILQKLPNDRQSLMFSATFSPEIKKLAKSFLIEPTIVETARQNAAAANVEQKVFLVHESQKTDALLELLGRFGESEDGEEKQAIIFVNAKITARRLGRQLERCGLSVDSIHGDRTQEERIKILQEFKDKTLRLLVATDVAARGLDIPEMPLVFNYDVPFVAEDYVHRIGRTGRAGAKGDAIMLMTFSDERNVEAIEKLIKKTFKRTKLDPVKTKIPKYKPSGSYQYAASEPEETDPFFNEPYVPQPVTASSEQKKSPSMVNDVMYSFQREKPVAALFGGSGKYPPRPSKSRR